MPTSRKQRRLECEQLEGRLTPTAALATNFIPQLFPMPQPAAVALPPSPAVQFLPAPSVTPPPSGALLPVLVSGQASLRLTVLPITATAAAPAAQTEVVNVSYKLSGTESASPGPTGAATSPMVTWNLTGAATITITSPTAAGSYTVSMTFNQITGMGVLTGTSALATLKVISSKTTETASVLSPTGTVPLGLSKTTLSTSGTIVEIWPPNLRASPLPLGATLTITGQQTTINEIVSLPPASASVTGSGLAYTINVTVASTSIFIVNVNPDGSVTARPPTTGQPNVTGKMMGSITFPGLRPSQLVDSLFQESEQYTDFAVPLPPSVLGLYWLSLGKP